MRDLTSGDVARLCGISVANVRKQIESGRLKAHVLPGCGFRRIKATDLRVFMKANGINTDELDRLMDDARREVAR